MKFKVILNYIGRILLLEAAVMILPLIVSLLYQEGFRLYISFLIPIAVASGTGLLLNIKKTKSKLRAKEGFVIVALSWILMSLVGSIPLMVSGDIPNFFDAFFEITSGFTTTGACVLNNVELLHKSIMFWRCFSHWLGGMGILVLILAFIPEDSDGTTVHILRAESPGPQVGKLVSKMRVSSRILYLIYIGITLTELIFLLVGPDKNIGLFEATVISFSTAGTGGFAPLSTSIITYSAYTQYVIACFMLVFAGNFTLYYLVLIGKVKEALKSEELHWYLFFIIGSVIIICSNIFRLYNTFEEAFRLSFFEVATTISTTGFTVVDYSVWPSVAKWVIVMLMLVGGCAGSTGGAIKVSRFAILFKTAFYKIKKMINPRHVHVVKFEGAPLSSEVIDSTQNFFIVYILLVGTITLAISLLNPTIDILSNLTATLSCIGNVGPAMGIVGYLGDFSSYSNASKIIFSLTMVLGRLEVYPLLILFAKSTWRKL